MRSFAIKVIVNALAIWMATLVVQDVVVGGGDQSLWSQTWTLLLIGLIFGVVNAVVKPVVQLLAMPFYILTLGLFAFVINAAMLELTALLAGDFFEVTSFWSGALPAAVIITFVSMVLNVILSDAKD